MFLTDSPHSAEDKEFLLSMLDASSRNHTMSRIVKQAIAPQRIEMSRLFVKPVADSESFDAKYGFCSRSEAASFPHSLHDVLVVFAKSIAKVAPSVTLMLENTLGSRTDDRIQRLDTPLWFYGDEVYSWVDFVDCCAESTENALVEASRGCGMVGYIIDGMSRQVGARILSSGTVGLLVKSVSFVFCEAFDGEGYVIARCNAANLGVATDQMRN